MAVLDDIKTSKLWVVGVISFATAVGAFLTTVCGFKPEPTIAVVAAFAIFLLFISWLIDRAEKRQIRMLKQHESDSNLKIAKYDATLNKLLEYAHATQLSNLRLEMDNTIDHNPADHTTILKYAEKYFMELDGDWVQTDIFIKWVKAEDKAGRPVHIPPELLAKVRAVKTSES